MKRYIDIIVILLLGFSFCSCGRDALKGYEWLEGKWISVTKLGTGAFFRCNSLTSVNILSDSFPFFNDAFAGCVSISSVRMPKKYERQVDFYGVFRYSESINIEYY